MGNYIRRRREELGLTLAELSERCGLSESALSLIERNLRTRLQFDTIAKLAQGLEVSIETLAKEMRTEVPA